MAQALIRAGHEVVMVCGSYRGGVTGLTGPFAKGHRRGCVDGMEVVELDLAYSNSQGLLQRASLFMRFAWRSILLAMTEKYDLVFATTTPLTAGIPALFARFLRRKPFVFEVRDLWPELPKAMGVVKNPLVLMAMSAIEWISYRSAHRLIGLSPGIVEGITRRGVDRKKVALIPNGCDLHIFANPRPGWRPDSIQASDLLAVFTGTHGLANGLNAVLDVAAELKRRGRRDIKLLLIGQGKLKPQLQARASQERLENIVFHDPVDKKLLSGLMASTDVGLQILANVPAFYYGTSPNKFFDYISSGLPVLTNYPGWIADIVRENRCGFAVPPENPKAFADALEQAADHRHTLQPMGERARALAERDFDRNKLAAAFVNWLVGARQDCVKEPM